MVLYRLATAATKAETHALAAHPTSRRPSPHAYNYSGVVQEVLVDGVELAQREVVVVRVPVAAD